MENIIRAYQNNTLPFHCISPIITTGYTPFLTVKKNITDTSTLISKTGTITDSSTLFFCLSSVDTSLAAGDYIFDITLEAEASIYTIVKDVFTVLDGVRY